MIYSQLTEENLPRRLRGDDGYLCTDPLIPLNFPLVPSQKKHLTVSQIPKWDSWIQRTRKLLKASWVPLFTYGAREYHEFRWCVHVKAQSSRKETVSNLPEIRCLSWILIVRWLLLLGQLRQAAWRQTAGRRALLWLLSKAVPFKFCIPVRKEENFPEAAGRNQGSKC